MILNKFRCAVIENVQNTFILFILTIIFGILIDYIMPVLDNTKSITYILIECYLHLVMIIITVYIINFIISKIPIFSCNNMYQKNLKYTEIIFAVIFYTTQLKLFDKLDYIVKKIVKN